VLVATVANPDVFDIPKDDRHHAAMARQYLEAVAANGVLLTHSLKALRGKLVDAAEKAPWQVRIEIEELLEQNDQPATKRIIACALDRLGVEGDSDAAAIALADHVNADAAVLSVGASPRETDSRDRLTEAFSLPDYQDSQVRSLQGGYLKGWGDFDTLPEATRGDLIGRATRYTKWIRFYDAYIGKTNGLGLAAWGKGLHYILKHWEDSAYFHPRQKGRVDIFTQYSGSGDPAGDVQRIQSRLLNPLESEFGMDISIHLKLDYDGLMHKRYVQTQSIAFSVDPGLDMFRRGHPKSRDFKPCSVKLELDATDRLCRIRALGDVV
jgi:hypothetical protein